MKRSGFPSHHDLGKKLAQAWGADLRTLGQAAVPDPFLRDWMVQMYDPRTDADAKDLALMKLRVGVQAWVLPYEPVDREPPAPGLHRLQRTSERPDLSSVEMTRRGAGTRSLSYTAALDGGGWLLLICGRGEDRSPTSEEVLDGADEVSLLVWYTGERTGEGPNAGGPDGWLRLGRPGVGYALYGAAVCFPSAFQAMEKIAEEDGL